ncbi:MAG: Ig-like domain-containing protein, partial [Cystobacter sp.]
SAGHTKQARLLVESRRPRAPSLALAAPTPGATIAEGSIQLLFDAVAVDDTQVAHVELFINGQPALVLRDGEDIPWSVAESGAVVITDPALRRAFDSLPPEDADLQRVKHYRGQVKLPPGFVALQPGRADAALQLRIVATDKEGHQTVLEQPLRIEADVSPPLVDMLRPVMGRNVVEGTSVLIEVAARDNVLVDRVELFAGPSASALRVVHVAGGFPPTNAVPGSPFDVYAPLVRYSFTVPTLAQLGSIVPVPYFVAARARDISGNWTAPADFLIQPIEIIQDQPPAVSLLSPADGTPAVAGSLLTVVAMAEDDVAVGNVRLEVDGVPLPLTLHVPPFSFQVPVPEREGVMRLRAVAVDSGGHEVGSQVLVLPLRGDQAPTVAVAQPRAGQRLTEGRDFALVVAAQDDVAITSVEVLVEGGLAGPLHLVASSPPYSFRVPLPPGSAGRTLRVLARARDSAGHEAVAPEVTALVVTDTSRPTVAWVHPAEGSQSLEGMVLDLEVDARDDVAVTSLELRLGDQPLAFMPTAPFRLTYRVPANAGGQTLVFSATARDPSGNQTVATRRIEVAEDEPPSVSVTAPTRIVVGSPALLRAQGSDDVAITEVGFHLGTDPGALREVARRYQLPYEFRYTATGDEVGQVLTVRARALDLAGHEAWSLPARVQVVPDKPPAVALTRPLAGESIFEGQRLRLEAEATDEEGPLKQVAFFVDGRKVHVATSPAGIPGAPHRFATNYSPPAGSGNRLLRLTAVAVDSAGQETESAPVVIGTVRDTVPPETQLVEPVEGDVITEAEPVEVAAAALDESAVVGVRFLVDGQQVGPPSTVPRPGPSQRPLYYGSWLPPSGAAGQSRTLAAEATDPSQNLGRSEPVTVELGLRPEPTAVLVAELFKRQQRGLAVDGEGLVIQGSLQGPDVNGLFEDGPPGRLALGRLDLNGLARLGRVKLPGEPVSTALLGRLALVATKSIFDEASKRVTPSLLQVVDLSNPAVPRIRGSVELPGSDVREVLGKDRLAFVANGSAGVTVVELGNPDAPQRAFTRPLVGPARGLALSDKWLLVAAGSGGLRVLDVRDPYLRELGFVALPGEANRVEVVGSRAYVGCSNAQAPLAVVDLSKPSQPRLLSLLSHAPRRADLRASEVTDVAVSGGVALVATALTDQDARPVKGLLSASMVKADGSASTFVRANLPGARDVAFSQGRPVALLGDWALGAFTLPRLAVTGMNPVDGADQVALSPRVTVSFSRPLDAASVDEQSVMLRARDAVLGTVVSASVEVEEGRVILTPRAPLPTNTDVFVTVLPTVSAEGGLALGERFVSRFRTRAAEGEPPRV